MLFGASELPKIQTGDRIRDSQEKLPYMKQISNIFSQGEGFKWWF